MFHEFRSRLLLSGDLLTQTALRIGAGRATEPGGSDLPVLRDSQGYPYIPGSSFKGVLRSYVESVARAVADRRRGACIPTGRDEERCLPDSRVKQIKANAAGDEEVATTLWEESCLVCRTFGSPWLASHVQVKDLRVDPEFWFDQYQVRDGVAIDRDTETAAEGLLYDYEVVPADTMFRCTIVMENGEPWQLGMLLLGLKLFEKGEISLGGFRSRGLGVVKLDWQGRYYEVPRRGNPGGPDPDWMIRYLEGKETGIDAREKMEDSISEFRRELIEAAVRRGEQHA